MQPLQRGTCNLSLLTESCLGVLHPAAKGVLVHFDPPHEVKADDAKGDKQQ